MTDRKKYVRNCSINMKERKCFEIKTQKFNTVKQFYMQHIQDNVNNSGVSL